jgi:nucleoside recognition membrane protein YjiH
MNTAGPNMRREMSANFIEKASRLYEQKRSAVIAATALGKPTSHTMSCRVERSPIEFWRILFWRILIATLMVTVAIFVFSAADAV